MLIWLGLILLLELESILRSIETVLVDFPSDFRPCDMKLDILEWASVEVLRSRIFWTMQCNQSLLQDRGQSNAAK